MPRRDDHDLGDGRRQYQGNRKMHEQRMKFTEQSHKRLVFEVPRQGSPCFVSEDRGGGGYIPWVVPLWPWNKPAGDGVSDLHAGFLTTVAGILLVRSSRAVPALTCIRPGLYRSPIGRVLDLTGEAGQTDSTNGTGSYRPCSWRRVRSSARRWWEWAGRFSCPQPRRAGMRPRNNPQVGRVNIGSVTESISAFGRVAALPVTWS
jgi:hypothetical protein